MSDPTTFTGYGQQKMGTYTPFILSNGAFTISIIDTNLYFVLGMIVSRGVIVQPDRDRLEPRR